MKDEGYICFDEQIQLTNQLFSEYPDVLKSYQQRFCYVMIDEFQDISSDHGNLHNIRRGTLDGGIHSHTLSKLTLHEIG